MSARKVEQNKITQDESGVSLEHHAAYDDDFLPSADELSKLKSIDPSIITKNAAAHHAAASGKKL